MIRKCPHCGIGLDKPPFNCRITNEVMLTLKYRELIESEILLEEFNDIKNCPVCNSTREDRKENLKT